MDIDEKSEEDQENAYEEHILDHCALDAALASPEAKFLPNGTDDDLASLIK